MSDGKAYEPFLRLDASQLLPLRTVQDQIGMWSEEQFGDNQSGYAKFGGVKLYSLPALLGIVEELGELIAPILKRHQGRGFMTEELYRPAVKDAIGDLLIFLCDFATREEIDLLQTLNETWDKVCKRRQRTWQADKDKEGIEAILDERTVVEAEVAKQTDAGIEAMIERQNQEMGVRRVERIQKRQQEADTRRHGADPERTEKCMPQLKVEQTGQGFAEPKEVVEHFIGVGPDGMCQCTCATNCPLGKTGMQARCTDEELALANIGFRRFAEPVEDESEEAGESNELISKAREVAAMQQAYVRHKHNPLTEDYPRLCSECRSNKIHKTNTIGVCANCYGLWLKKKEQTESGCAAKIRGEKPIVGIPEIKYALNVISYIREFAGTNLVSSSYMELNKFLAATEANLYKESKILTETSVNA